MNCIYFRLDMPFLGYGVKNNVKNAYSLYNIYNTGQKFGNITIFTYVFERSFLYSPLLHYFDQKYRKKN